MSDTEARDRLVDLIEWAETDTYATSQEDGMPRADILATAILEAGWRPPARTVSTVEEVAALPHMTVIRSAPGTVMEKWEDGQWRPTGMHNTWPRVELPATVLYEPKEGE